MARPCYVSLDNQPVRRQEVGISGDLRRNSSQLLLHHSVEAPLTREVVGLCRVDTGLVQGQSFEMKNYVTLDRSKMRVHISIHRRIQP